MVFLPEEKVSKIRAKAVILLSTEKVALCDLASFTGLVVSLFHAILEAPLHYRTMERLKVKGLGIEGNFDNKACLSKESIEELLWWKYNVSLKNGKQIRLKKAAFSCRTDACFSGWGGIDLGSERIAQNRWSSQQLDNSINFLELLAIFNVLQAFYSEVEDVHIEIQCDNITAVTYINDMGGMCHRHLIP